MATPTLGSTMPPRAIVAFAGLPGRLTGAARAGIMMACAEWSSSAGVARASRLCHVSSAT